MIDYPLKNMYWTRLWDSFLWDFFVTASLSGSPGPSLLKHCHWKSLTEIRVQLSCVYMLCLDNLNHIPFTMTLNFSPGSNMKTSWPWRTSMRVPLTITWSCSCKWKVTRFLHRRVMGVAGGEGKMVMKRQNEEFAQEDLKCQESCSYQNASGCDMFCVDRGVKLGLIIELGHTSTTLPVVKIFPTSQQIAVTPTHPSSPAAPDPSPETFWTSTQLKGYCPVQQGASEPFSGIMAWLRFDQSWLTLILNVVTTLQGKITLGVAATGR